MNAIGTEILKKAMPTKIFAPLILLSIDVPCIEYHKFITDQCEHEAVAWLRSSGRMKEFEDRGYRLDFIQQDEYNGKFLSLHAGFILEGVHSLPYHDS